MNDIYVLANEASQGLISTAQQYLRSVGGSTTWHLHGHSEGCTNHVHLRGKRNDDGTVDMDSYVAQHEPWKPSVEDIFWLEVAKVAATRADCTRRQVGAALVQQGRIIGVGWNGGVDASCTAGECPRGQLSFDEQPSYKDSPDKLVTNCIAIHAEHRAILMAGPAARCANATMYITDEPCSDCVQRLRDVKIVTVMYPTGFQLLGF